jgi:gluconolactonase
MTYQPAPPSNPSSDYHDDPNSRLRIYDSEFLKILGDNAAVTELVQTNAHEGPVYLSDSIYFTTAPDDISVPIEGYKNVAVRRFSLGNLSDNPAENQCNLSTLRDPSNMANGMTSDRAGNLIICEQGTKTEPAAISSLNPETGEYVKLVEEWFGLPFNSPNDVVVKSDGSIWFTDPCYGFFQGFKNEPLVGNFVYRFDPESRVLSVVADDFNRPNGLAFSPDEKILYINDSGALQGSGPYHPDLPHHIRAFDLSADGQHLENNRLITLVTPGIPDGLKTDNEDRIYSSAQNGVQVFSRAGKLLGLIEVPGVANFTFGGEANDTIYIMADTAIWSVKIAAKGASAGASC